eukprot:CAMPEP_0119560316 /NCGR_PEP_ID=MMETSP1352-20130426/14557_1 /TAXON_ID=265584 /ORGANISM="Stauroneis constricta, Strain CCMP1120" /LENGTH=274 /DNA_ID=CAMNT_0007608271 /DNA_START=76 /DNA_END=900 /DNA_ORIENTATION=+
MSSPSPKKVEPGGPEDHWTKHVLREVTKEQIGFIAEGLFKELWARCGKEVAVDQVSLLIAEVQFSRGFDLLYKLKDHDAAFTEFQKCLSIREKILGKDHRDTGKTYCFVAHALREQKEYDEAVGYYRSALRILVALLGKDHNHTKDVINCIENSLHSDGLDDAEVSEYKSTLLSSMEHKSAGDRHAEEGDFDKALASYNSALVVEKIHDAEDHPDTGDIHAKIAACLARQGDTKKARKKYAKAFAIYVSTLGSDHPDTLEAKKSLDALPSPKGR